MTLMRHGVARVYNHWSYMTPIVEHAREKSEAKVSRMKKMMSRLIRVNVRVIIHIILIMLVNIAYLLSYRLTEWSALSQINPAPLHE
jgi:cell division septal protein FtsQ